MPKYTEHPPVAGVFQALSDGTRLAVLERLSVGPVSVSELARSHDMALPSFMQHLAVLERAGVVRSHKSGRTRVFQLDPLGLQAAARWLETFRNHWERRLDQLEAVLLADSHSTDPPGRQLTATAKEQR